MSRKSAVREVEARKDGIGSLSRRVIEPKHWCGRTSRSNTAPDAAPPEAAEQGRWANLPPELLLDIMRRVEESETAWPARITLVFCASVCRSWRDVTKKIVKTPEECGRITFPISLKQPGPRDVPIQCFIRRDRATSTYRLYFGPNPSEDENDKFLLAAKKTSRATRNDFVISLAADDFSRARNTYLGKLRSNFLRSKFTIYDRQSPNDAALQQTSLQSRGSNTKQVAPRLPAYNYSVATVSYEVNPPGRRGPRKMHCTMLSVPVSRAQEGGTSPTPASFPQVTDECRALRVSKETYFSSQKLSSSSMQTPNCGEALVVKNKAPRWHDQMHCWCLDFKGRVTEKSIKNFQLLAAVDPSLNISAAEEEKVILQFGRIGRDVFVMDYCYPLCAFQAFAICLSSFDANTACVG